MSAMGLGDGGDKALEGITRPPGGKDSGLATPEVSAQLDQKKDLQAKVGGKPAAPGPGGGGAATPTGPGPGGGGAAKPAGSGSGGAAKPAAPASGGAPAGGASSGGDHAQAPQAPEAPGPEGATAPAGRGIGSTDPDDGNDAQGAGSVEAMIEQLERSDDPAARKHAAEALGKSRSPRAKPALEKALRDPDPGVVAAATKALAQLGQLR